MGGTYASLHVHIAFACKGRQPLLAHEWRSDLHAYMGGIAKRLHCRPLAIGGVEDHVHLLLGYPPKLAVADIVREVKMGAGNWIREDRGVIGFLWQEGYGAFATGLDHLPAAVEYIANQEEHHRKWSYHGEFLRLCAEHGLEADPRYVE